MQEQIDGSLIACYLINLNCCQDCRMSGLEVIRSSISSLITFLCLIKVFSSGAFFYYRFLLMRKIRSVLTKSFYQSFQLKDSCILTSSGRQEIMYISIRKRIYLMLKYQQVKSQEGLSVLQIWTRQ